MKNLCEKIKSMYKDKIEYMPLNAILDYIQPTNYLVSSTDYKDDYEIPVLTAGQTFILGYTNETNGIYQASKEKPVIIFDDFTTSFHWVDFPFKVKSSAMKMLIVKDEMKSKVDFRYMFYIMSNIKYEPKEHSRQWIQTYSNFEIAVPPMEAQREIVHILDEFSLLSAELSAELKARQQQYKYYRDKLLSFDEKAETLGVVHTHTHTHTQALR